MVTVQAGQRPRGSPLAPRRPHLPAKQRHLSDPRLPGCPLQRARQFPLNGQDQQLGLGDVTQSAWGFTHSALKPKRRKNTLMGPISKKTGQPAYTKVECKFDHLHLWFAAHPSQSCGLLALAIHAWFIPLWKGRVPIASCSYIACVSCAPCKRKEAVMGSFSFGTGDSLQLCCFVFAEAVSFPRTRKG